MIINRMLATAHFANSSRIKTEIILRLFAIKARVSFLHIIITEIERCLIVTHVIAQGQ